MIRFWRPKEEGSPDELSLVGCVASSQHLWVITEGPGLAPPARPGIAPEPQLLNLHVTLASGVELRSLGGSGGGGREGRHFHGQFQSPPEAAGPLTVRLTKDDGTGIDRWTIVWEIQVFPVTQLHDSKVDH